MDEHVVGVVEGRAQPGTCADHVHELAVVAGQLELRRVEIYGSADRLLEVAAGQHHCGVVVGDLTRRGQRGQPGDACGVVEPLADANPSRLQRIRGG
jgi:hypothetical protein